MPVQIGAKSHSFSDPTGLLSDCHRRIELFLRTLQAVAAVADQPPSAETSQSLRVSLKYFREAAPKHTEDEEVSLFPRLRQLGDLEVQEVLAEMDRLEDDHRRADRLHGLVDHLGNEYLQSGVLAEGELATFRKAISDLAAIYGDHIRLEDTVLFPVAAKLLSSSEKKAIGREMASRRAARIDLIKFAEIEDRLGS